MTAPTSVPVDPHATTRRMHGERRMVHASRFRARPYWLGTAGWIIYFASPIVPGWLIGQIFDEYQNEGATSRAAVLVGLLVVAELAIIWGIAVAHRQYIRGVEAAKANMRANVLDAQLASGGVRAGRRDVPIGDVLVRLRDDPFDMLFLLDNWVDLVGSILYSSAAAYFLFRIDAWAAVAGIVPLLALGFANRLISARARRYRAQARVAASDVSSFLNATFEASLTVKVTGARRHVLDAWRCSTRSGATPPSPTACGTRSSGPSTAPWPTSSWAWPWWWPRVVRCPRARSPCSSPTSPA